MTKIADTATRHTEHLLHIAANLAQRIVQEHRGEPDLLATAAKLFILSHEQEYLWYLGLAPRAQAAYLDAGLEIVLPDMRAHIRADTPRRAIEGLITIVFAQQRVRSALESVEELLKTHGGQPSFAAKLALAEAYLLVAHNRREEYALVAGEDKDVFLEEALQYVSLFLRGCSSSSAH